MPATGLPDGRVPVVLSAHAEDLVAVDAEAILRYLDTGPEVPAVAAALLRTRRLRRHRVVVRAADTAELAAGLRAVIATAEHPLVARSAQSAVIRTAFVFPGQGSQWASMGTDAYRRSPVYRTCVEECADAFVAAGARSPLPYLTAAFDGGTWSQADVQAAQFTHAVGLAHLWRSCGIVPDLTVGHSLGEVAAAHVAGAITLSVAVAVVVARATAVEALRGDYGMAALGVSLAQAEALIAAVDGWLEVSAVNSGASVVVSGEHAAVVALVAAATQRGHFARQLAVNYPGHTSVLERLRDDLVAVLPDGRFAHAPTPFIGSTTGGVVGAGTQLGDYWYRNLRHTVRFDRAVAAAQREGADAFVEMSAHPTLLSALDDLLDDAGEPLVLGSGRRDEPLVDTVSANIAAAAVADPGHRWADLVDVAAAPLLRGFPNAPTRAVRLWAPPRPPAPVHGLTVARERWEATTVVPATAARVAVVDLAGADGALGDRLRAALARSTAELTEPGDADLVVAVAPLLDHPDAERAAHDIARLTGTGLLDYPDSAGRACRAVCLVTVGGEHVRPGEPVALPAQAALAAMHRSVGFEHPEQVFRHLDLPSAEPGDALAAAAVNALRSDLGEVAVRESERGPMCFVRTVVEPLPPAPSRPLVGAVLDDVVITGGSGALGLHFARQLAARGARRIVLLSRGGVDDASRAALETPGVQVVAPTCDVTSADDVSAAADRYGGLGASLLIHAAGAATFADRDGVTTAAFADAAAAKIGGLARMLECWPIRSDARILLCSSVSGVWGGRGHAAYSAANRMLDVMAGQLRAKGQQCVSVRYGLWRGDGIAGAAEVARIERSGLVPMVPDDAVAAGLSDHTDDPLVLSANRTRLTVFLDSQSAPADDTGSPAPGVDTASRVRAELAAVLDLEATAIDLETSLLDLGVDSLLALDLRKRLQRATGGKVALATLLGGITGGELIASLQGARTDRQKVDTSD